MSARAWWRRRHKKAWRLLHRPREETGFSDREMADMIGPGFWEAWLRLAPATPESTIGGPAKE